ncbi:MAG: AsmA-like C-terminal domain-containing protein [Deltaproteobacteria bacterium]|nr:AsmA-like C-terminal domain-containing protein [Deltaproteobacteria bacterium]
MAKDSTVRKRQIAAALAALFTALFTAAALYLSLVPIDLTDSRDKIESFVEARVDGHIDIGSITIKLLPSPDVRITGFRAYDDKEDIINARSLRFKVSLLPLLARKLVLENFEADGIGLNIRRHKDGELNLAGFLKQEKDREEEKKGRKRKFGIKSFKVTDGYIKMTDETTKTPAAYEVTGINGYLYGTPEGSVYRTQGLLMPATKITFSGVNKAGLLNGTGAINNIDLAALNPYLGGKGSLSGKADILLNYGLNHKDFADGILIYRDLTVSYPAALGRPITSRSGSAIIEASSEGDEKTISIRDATIAAMDFILRGDISLSGPDTGRAFAVKLSTSPVPLKTIKELVPVNAIPKDAAEKINRITPIGGAVTVHELSAKGLVGELKGGEAFKKPGALTFRASFGGIGFNYAGLDEPLTGLSGGFTIKNNKLTLDDITARYGDDIIEAFNGEVSDLTGTLAYKLSLQGLFEAAETLGLAKQLFKEGSAVSERLKKADAGGELRFTVSATGAVKGGQPLRYAGNTELKSGWFSYEGMPPIESINASLDFDEKTATIDELTIGDGSSDLRIEGRIDGYREKTPAFDIKTEGVLGGETVSKALAGRKAGADLIFTGKIGVAARVYGNTGSFAADARLDTGTAHIEYKKYIRKEENYPLAIDTSFTLEGSRLGLKGAVMTFGASSAEVSGTLYLDKPVYDLSVFSNQLNIIDLDDISPLLSSGNESAGLVAFKINTVKASPEKAASLEGDIRIKGARFKSPYIAKPVEEINATALFKENKGNIYLDGLSVGETNVTGRVDILDIEARKINFILTSPRFQTSDFFVKKDKEKTEEEAEEPTVKEENISAAPPVTGTGRIIVKEGTLWGHPFNEFSTDIRLDEKAVYVSPLSILIDRGKMTGDLTLFRDKNEPLLFKTNLSVSNVHLESVIAGFGAKKSIITGDLKGTLSLSGARGSVPFSRGLNGEATLRSEKGRLWKFPILTNIFSIVNILSIDEALKEGLPYRSLGGDFSLIDGVVSTNNVHFDSKTMRMSGVGEVNLPDSHIDVLLALHPFVTIDKIISHIPLAGWILTGKEKSTISMYFSIEGPLKKPDIDPVPIKSIQEGVFGILERIIEAPQEFIRELRD